MKLKDFYYDLPKNLIAQTPIKKRDHSRLLILEKKSGNIQEKFFYDILKELGENDVLVLNETKTIKARLYGIMEIFPKGKSTFKKIEIFLHEQISNDTWECIGYPGNNLKIGKIINFYDNNGNIVMTGKIEKISENGRYIKFNKTGLNFLQVLEQIGKIPLPPYITEKLDDTDRYQTVFAKKYGSVASPTAGFHFTEELLKKLEKKGVIIEKILLHIGIGTFRPIETENIEDHKIHKEYIQIEKEVSDRLNHYKKSGKNIIAVGTTTVRTLESFVLENSNLGYGNKETSIFIYPGYDWKFVDSIITNFHLPNSTLLMLVSSFGGMENIKNAYKLAIKNNYRFFSFGDAMRIK